MISYNSFIFKFCYFIPITKMNIILVIYYFIKIPQASWELQAKTL